MYLTSIRRYFIVIISVAFIVCGVSTKLNINLKHKTTSRDEWISIVEEVLQGNQFSDYIPFKYGKIPLYQDSNKPSSVIPLINFLNAQFYAMIELGNPAQTLAIMFDTGSSNMFVLAPNCTGLACWGRAPYNFTNSTSFTPNGTYIDLGFGSGNFSGFLGSDNINLGNSSVQQVPFALIDNPDSQSFLYARFDGLIGMAYQTLAIDNITPIFQMMIDQGLVTEPSFSFYLTKDYINTQNGSALILGGVDMKYAKSNFTYVNLTHDSFYMVDLDNILVGNQSFISQKMNAIVDTGTSIIVGSEEVINPILALFPDQIECSKVSSYGDLTFVINGINYSIPPEIYIIEQFGHCILGIVAAIFTAELQNTIVLGDVFIRNYYTHFDYGNARIGFAEAANITQEVSLILE